MLARYKIYRGKRPPNDPLPEGIRQDARWRTRHPLRPSEELVKRYLVDPSEEAWQEYVSSYLNLLEERFRQDRTQFDALAALAMEADVFIGCSCPTKTNPHPGHCHTFLALEFMKSKYPLLQVTCPG